MTEKPQDITKAFQGMLTQAETNYVPLSATAGKACASCRWFMNGGCFIVESYEPEPIMATGYCDRWETAPEPKPDMAEVVAEAVEEAVEATLEAIPMLMDMGKARPTPKPFMQRLRELITPKPKDDAFSVFKGVDGAWHWHAVFTNNFEDLEGEILTEKAHDNYIARLDMGLVPMPILMAWHTPGTEHGEADVIWRNDHFVHAIGHFDDTPAAQKAIQFYQKNAGKIKMSHGFTAPLWAFDGKHYDDYNTIEITTLPPYAAANPYTSFEELLTMQKTMPEDKRRYLENVVGKDKAAEIIAGDEQRGKALEDLKIAYKDVAQVTVTAEKPAASGETEKALSVLYTEMVENSDEMLDIIKLQAKALTDKDAQLKALEAKYDARMQVIEKDNAALRALVNMPPRRASQDSSTVVDKDNDALKDALPPATDPVGSWLGLPVKAKTT